MIVWARTPSSGQTEATERSRIGLAMELRSVTDMPTGCRSNVLVDVITKTDDYIVCRDVPFGSSLVVQFGGHMDQRMMLYQATKLGCKHDQHEIFALDPKYDPLPVNIPRELDFLSSHDVLCGLGGFSSSFSFLSMSVITAVDWNCLASVSYQMNHTTSFLLADIDPHDTVYKMHQAQNAAGCQPVLAAGIPVRSRTLPAVLRAAYWLNTAGLLLECAPEAAHDFSTQAAIREYAQLRGCDIFQKVLHLHSCWPARRSRWIALIVPSSLGFLGLKICLYCSLCQFWVSCFHMILGRFGHKRTSSNFNGPPLNCKPIVVPTLDQ